MTRVLSWMVEHQNGLTFTLGFGLLYAGLAHWSVGAANLAAGVVLMAIGAAPFLRTRTP